MKFRTAVILCVALVFLMLVAIFIATIAVIPSIQEQARNTKVGGCRDLYHVPVEILTNQRQEAASDITVTNGQLEVALAQQNGAGIRAGITAVDEARQRLDALTKRRDKAVDVYTLHIGESVSDPSQFITRCEHDFHK